MNFELSSAFRNALAWRYFVPVVLGIALVLRLGWIAWIWNAGARPASDAAWYLARALEISSGAGYAVEGVPTAYWPVGYPGFLALLVELFGGSPLAGMLANVALYLGAMTAAWAIARKLFGSEIVGRLTLLALALWPNHIAYSSLLLSESLFLFLVLTGIALLLAEWRPVVAVVSSGVIFGLAVLVKPQALVIPLLCGIAILICRRNRRHVWELTQRLALVHVIMVLTIIPWMLRNQKIFGEHGILSTNDGINLLIGNNPGSTGAYAELDEGLENGLRNRIDERGRNIFARNAALDYISSNPLETLERIPLKLWYAWRADTEGFSHNATGLPPEAEGTRRTLALLKIISEIFYLAAGAAFLAYWLRRWRRREISLQPRYSIGIWIIGYFAILPVIFFGDGRFHFPAIPWIAMYASAFVGSLLPATERFPGIPGGVDTSSGKSP